MCREEENGKGAYDGDGDEAERNHFLEFVDLGLHVIYIDARSENPSPGCERLYTGDLGDDIIFFIEVLPSLVHKTGSVSFTDVDHLHEQMLSVGIFVVGKRLSVRLCGIRMHDHDRPEVADPQIIASVFFIAQLSNAFNRLLLRFLSAESAFPFLIMK